jgi:excisionase family DNA binding protein
MQASRGKRPNELTLYTTWQAARLLNVHPQTLANWRAGQGDVELPFVKIGRAVRYRHEDIAAFIRSHSSKRIRKAE